MTISEAVAEAISAGLNEIHGEEDPANWFHRIKDEVRESFHDLGFTSSWKQKDSRYTLVLLAYVGRAPRSILGTHDIANGVPLISIEIRDFDVISYVGEKGMMSSKDVARPRPEAFDHVLTKALSHHRVALKIARFKNNGFYSPEQGDRAL